MAGVAGEADGDVVGEVDEADEDVVDEVVEDEAVGDEVGVAGEMGAWAPALVALGDEKICA